MISRCALGLIADRGGTIIAPTLNTLSASEQDFLSRHVEQLRSRSSTDGAVFCVFGPKSSTKSDLTACLSASNEDFVVIAEQMTNALATNMLASPAAARVCVVALTTSCDEPSDPPKYVTFLKLDARIQAARLIPTTANGPGIKLEVFQDLRASGAAEGIFMARPERSIVNGDISRHQSRRRRSLFSQRALLVSGKAVETEKALVHELVTKLGPDRARQAVAEVDRTGGRADSVIAKRAGGL